MYDASHEEEQEGMGTEDAGPNPDELVRRIEALERENRELRDALASGAPHGEAKGALQQPQASGAPDASPKTVRGLFLGPRNERAYSEPCSPVDDSFGLLPATRPSKIAPTSHRARVAPTAFS